MTYRDSDMHHQHDDQLIDSDEQRAQLLAHAMADLYCKHPNEPNVN